MKRNSSAILQLTFIAAAALLGGCAAPVDDTEEGDEDAAAQAEAEAEAEDAAAVAEYHDVWLTTSGGFFVLHWSASTVGRWDWVGIFDNAGVAQSAPNDTYLGGSCGWQWVERGSPYTTCVPATSGKVAAYIVWDYGADRYTAIDVSGPWP